jgi:hypothetical protein
MLRMDVAIASIWLAISRSEPRRARVSTATLGDAMHAVLCRAGLNLRMILRKLRLLCAFILAALFICGIAADVMV